MKILFLSHYFSPHIGGVEKHVLELSRELIKKGHEVTVITYKFSEKLEDRQTYKKIKIIRFYYPNKKYLGLLHIWHFIWQKRALILQSDVIHIHDVFIWYLPYRFLFFWKKVYITIHGYVATNPFSYNEILQKKIAVFLSSGSIGIGKFIEKYANIKFDLVSYGATNIPKLTNKEKNRVVFIGRLSKDTGILQFLKWLESNKKYKVDFVGDGELKDICKKFGSVHGFTNPEKYLKSAEYAIPGGYLACLEAFSYKCKVKVFWNSKLKKDYWQMSPVYEFIRNEDVIDAYVWAKKQTWGNLTDEYLKLWTR